jgi:hypothetical protein
MKMAGAELLRILPETCTAISAMHESLFLLMWCGLVVLAIYTYIYIYICIWIQSRMYMYIYIYIYPRPKQ